MKNQNNIFAGVSQSFRFYWRIYGGWKELVRSPYLCVALVFSAAAYPAWLHCAPNSCWWDSALTVIPSVLGFALGGYTMMLAFGGERFTKIFAGSDPDTKTPSPFLMLNGTFVHFIIVNVLAVICALLAKAWQVSNPVANFLGFALFVYGLLTAVATTLTILFMAEMYDIAAVKHSGKQD